jgi:hypothetical protein
MPMNPFSKILLSADELQLVTNTDWILTKRKIIDKVNLLLGDISEQQKMLIENECHWLPAAVVQSTPKIAKGENYLGLPYLLLDYPRCFSDDHIFAVRTMFWWGNFFSISLHLSGTYKEIFQQKIIENIDEVTPEVFICINETQWQHHFEADNYTDIKKISVDELQHMILEKEFIKLAIKFPLQSWNDIPSLLENSFTEIITMLKG